MSDHPRDIGEDSTLGAEPVDAERATGERDDVTPTAGVPEDTASVSGIPAPELLGLVDEAERTRVRQALFGGSSESFSLGRYVIIGTLGRGGMGVVFKAFDPDLDRRVALKVLHAEFDQAQTTRLRREAQAMAKLSHPHVVQVYEVGQIEGQTFVAMELVEGQTLREWMRQQPRPSWRRSVEVFIQAGRGLAAAHDRGLVHRDFKPGNAILDEDRARVLDFGLARKLDEIDLGVPSAVLRARTNKQQVVPLEASLTNTGAVLGTPAYMPPEQMQGQEADARSDQFSFCVALYEAVYGERPYEGGSMAALLVSMTSGQVRPAPKGSAVPSVLRAALLRGLATDPRERWPSMEALLEQLERLVAPRRRPWVAVSLGVGLLAIGGGLFYQAQLERERQAQRCRGTDRQLDGIWDDARRRAVKDALLGSDRPHALDTWTRVEQHLDDYAQAWVVERTEVCQANPTADDRSTRQTLAQVRCLNERKSALRATVDVLAQADAQVLDKAVKVVIGLPRLARCDDMEALLADIPPPEDPQVAEQVEALREQLVFIGAMDKAGRYTEARRHLEPIAEQADGLGYGPLQAETTYWRAELLLQEGRYAKSEQRFKEAHALAIEHEHARIEFKVAQTLTFVVGDRLARHVEAFAWGHTALALAKRSGDLLEEAASLNALGTVSFGQGEYADARHHYQQALQRLEKTPDADPLQVAMVLGNLGNVLRRQGEYADAERQLRRALQLQERTLGAHHPKVARALGSLGHVLLGEGEYAEARQHYQRALQIQEKALDAQHPHVALSLAQLGLVLHRQGEHEEAKRYHQRALKMSEQALGAEHPHVAMSLGNLGNVLESQGEYEDAKHHHQRALQIWEKVLGADHPEVAMSLGNLGRVLESLGEYEDAKHLYRRALQIAEKSHGGDHPNVTDLLVGLAETALALRDDEAARGHAERAVSILEATTVAPELLAEARFLLARALWSDQSQRAHARTLAEQARQVLVELDGTAVGLDVELAKVDDWLTEHRVR